jgi:electron transfer flavoprotein beta subunit
MNILVCISKVPDTTSKIAFTADHTQFDSNGVTWIVNPSDEWYALVRALELKETLGGKVTIVTVGDATDDQVIRKALAIGADEAVRIDAVAQDAGFVAKEIAQYAKGLGFDLILTGKETIDYNGSMVAGLIAAHLDLPYVAFVEKLDVSGTTFTMHRDIGGGTETVRVTGPVVVSANKGLAEQRIPNMRGIMAARTKPIQVIPASSSAGEVTITSYALPPAKGAVKMLTPDQMKELVRLLHEEAKVI